jgi:catechol 2,3-dioxygenase-like lactoylglutathione lyase family enzyme
MIDHTGIAVSDYARSKTFYDAAFGALGGSMLMQVPTQFTGGKHVVGYGRDKPVFWLREGGEPGPGRHVAFTAQSRTDVDAFYKSALAAGGTDNGAPGLRPHYHADYYGAFVLDPDGNNIEAVCHRSE